MRMMIGDADGRHVDITLTKQGRGVTGFTVATRAVGAPGSRLRLSVDGRPPFLSAILTARECHFEARGSICAFTVPRGGAAFRAAIAAFRHGHVAHVEIENAGNVAMSRSVSLHRLSHQLATR